MVERSGGDALVELDPRTLDSLRVIEVQLPPPARQDRRAPPAEYEANHHTDPADPDESVSGHA